jgi:competence ComEA-like helix-hairpin-helix protein
MGEQESEVLEGQELAQEEEAVEVVETADVASEQVDAAPEVGDAQAPTVDLNTATEEELQQLPGIGAALAARIVDYRTEAGPFDDPAEVTAVAGISESTYERLANRLRVSSVEPPPDSEPEPALPEPEALEESPELEAEFQAEEDEALIEPEPEAADMEIEEPEGAPVLVSEPLVDEAGLAEEPEPEPDSEYVVAAPPPGPEPPLVEVVQARYGCARLLLFGLLSTILGAALALLLLFLVNGTLDFQSAAIRAAQDEVLRMEGIVGALEMKAAELEERVGAIQELEARLTDTQAGLRSLAGDLGDVRQRFELLAETQDALRQEFTNLREDLDGLTVHVSVMDRRVSGLETQLRELETQVAFLNRKVEILGESIRRFDAFLIGLEALLNETQGDLAPTPTPWITPVPTPTAWQTPTLRPRVTVIPLATSTPPAP